MALRDLPRLRILNDRISSSAPHARASVEIYRPFFVAGILCVLTVGCLLGAVALAGIAFNASYTASVWTPYVLAHANSQLYGWVGFFVMGFSLQQHAPSVSRAKVFHRLAYASLVLMALGIAVRFAAEPLVAVHRDVWLPIGVAACIAQAVAVGLFILNTQWTRHRTGQPMPWQSVLILTSLVWLLAVAIAEPFYFAQSHALNPPNRILFIAKWFPPYREAQFLGFAGSMIFGVALSKMHTCFGAARASSKLGLAGFGLFTVGLLMRMGGWTSAFGQNLSTESLRTYFFAGPMMLAGALLMVMATRMFGRLEFEAPSQKFIRAAFAWLLTAGLLLVFEPVHLAAIGQPFSHAYTGAIRHAVTVGFISQMIVGVGMHVAARMNDIPRDFEKPLVATFWLLNLGNAARVGLEILTDYSGGAFAPMGLTGFIELTGLFLWGAYVVRLVLRPRSLAHA